MFRAQHIGQHSMNISQHESLRIDKIIASSVLTLTSI